jgi:hypothetical protein
MVERCERVRRDRAGLVGDHAAAAAVEIAEGQRDDVRRDQARQERNAVARELRAPVARFAERVQHVERPTQFLARHVAHDGPPGARRQYVELRILRRVAARYNYSIRRIEGRSLMSPRARLAERAGA